MSFTRSLVHAALCAVLLCGWAGAAPTYRSPADLAWSPDGLTLAVADHTAGRLVLISGGAIQREIPLQGEPRAVAWTGDTVLVAEYDAGHIALVDAHTGSVNGRIPVGPKPSSIAMSPDGATALITDFGRNELYKINLQEGSISQRYPAVHQPMAAAITPDGRLALVANLLPAAAATDPGAAAAVNIIDLANNTQQALPLLPGSTNLKSLCISPDGAYAFAAHNIARMGAPTTQLDRGWINTNAISIIDLHKRALMGAVLLDRVDSGAADPWGVATDGERLWITIAGTNELAVVDLPKLFTALAQESQSSPYPENRSKAVPPSALLGFLDSINAIRRYPLPIAGPRAIALSPDGQTLAIAGYFSGAIAFVDAANPGKVRTVALPGQPPPDAARRGEELFHAALGYQSWLSCATCHFDGRADGLNWDLLNDGMGNPKNSRSLLHSPSTLPLMTLAVYDNLYDAAVAGFHFLGHSPTEQEINDLATYLQSLRPELSPWREEGKLSEAAQQGEFLFYGPARCYDCHDGDLYTDLKRHPLDTPTGPDAGHNIDTPTLIELWRTAPYLHDGQATTLQHAILQHAPDAHNLSPEELAALAEYLRSL